MALFEDVQGAAVYLAYRFLVTGQTNGQVQPWDLYSRQIVDFSNDYLWRALLQAEKNGLLESEEIGSKYFYITDKGLKAVKFEEKIYRARYERVCNTQSLQSGRAATWRDTDDLGSLSELELNEIRRLLTECRNGIANAQLNQIEKSQTDQHVKAAQEIVEAPTPKLRALWQLIKPFTESFLSEMAKRIINIIMPGG